LSKKILAKTLVNFLKTRYKKEIPGTYRDPFRVLISCILSQRTREENTAAASRALFKVASTPSKILEIPETKLQKLIKVAGFAKQKAKRIRLVSKIILTKYEGRVPKRYEELLELPGVGPKTANVVLCYGFNIPCIPVDTHVNRISRRLGKKRLADHKSWLGTFWTGNLLAPLPKMLRLSTKSTVPNWCPEA